MTSKLTALNSSTIYRTTITACTSVLHSIVLLVSSNTIVVHLSSRCSTEVVTNDSSCALNANTYHAARIIGFWSPGAFCKCTYVFCKMTARNSYVTNISSQALVLTEAISHFSNAQMQKYAVVFHLRILETFGRKRHWTWLSSRTSTLFPVIAASNQVPQECKISNVR